MSTKGARLMGWGECVRACAGAGSGNIEVSSKSEQGVNSLADVPWRRFLNNKALWGLVAVHCSFGVGPLVCLSWLPSYYSDVRCSVPPSSTSSPPSSPPTPALAAHADTRRAYSSMCRNALY